jgi:hypothetical protein
MKLRGANLCIPATPGMIRAKRKAIEEGCRNGNGSPTLSRLEYYIPSTMKESESVDLMRAA